MYGLTDIKYSSIVNFSMFVPKLSIVTTLYKSEAYVQEYYKRTSAVAQVLVGDNYEIILVNDGSPDSSLEQAVNLTKEDSRVITIDLSRNFGHHKAIMTGLNHAKGEKIFLIDSDLEEQPEWLLAFAEQMEREQVDVVYGIQRFRKGGIFERYSGHLFYYIFNFLTGMDLVPNISTVRLMTRRYVHALIQHQEREIYFPGLCHITGFEQRGHVIDKHSTSQTTYTLSRKLALLVNSLTSFSNVPLVAIFYIGMLILFFSSMYTGYLAVDRFFFHKVLTGWTSLMTSIWFLGGLIISFIGIVGIYLSKVFLEIKERPYTIIRGIYKQRKKK